MLTSLNALAYVRAHTAMPKVFEFARRLHAAGVQLPLSPDGA
jgi:hypothetical protein